MTLEGETLSGVVSLIGNDNYLLGGILIKILNIWWDCIFSVYLWRK